MGALPAFVDLLWTIRMESDSNTAPFETTKIIVAVVAVLVLIIILFFVSRVLMFRRRTQVHPRAERSNNADNDYLMYAYLQTQSPSVVRMRRLANTDGLSVQELNEAAPVKSFSNLHDSSEDNICAVCLEEMQVDAKTRTMPCGHEFDARCIEEWVSKANRCPVCNTQVVDEETLQKRRIAALEGRDPSPTTVRQRRRRARGENGTYELHDGSRFNGQERPQQDAEDDTENPGVAAGSSDLQQDSAAAQPGRGRGTPSRQSERADGADQEVRRGGSARLARALRPAEV